MAGANGLALTVTERACGGPGFSAFFSSDGQPIVTGGVTVTDTEIFRVDVEVPAMTDGTDCEYTIEPSGLLCYRTDDVIADGPAGEQLLSEAGYPTGEVVSPASGDVVAVTATYTDLCSEVRAEVDGLGDREVLVQMQSEPVDPADRSVDCGDVGPSPIPVPFSSGTWLVAGTATAGSTATVALFAYSPSGPLVPDEGCTITPASDQFIIEYPVTTRQFTAVCAAAAPVPAEPTFTG